ncbi:DUF2871 family protein [Ornithinimicrobium panacihumi]|uniref:DUF2871 family protein n=1 Tax=Ornithinimicrobium panacihumi TaxID=2008449 RepID=UPI003F8C3D76
MLTYLFRSAAAWTAIGLAGGLYYREFTKLNEFDFASPSQLGLVHTHALTWGTIFMLVLLGLGVLMPALTRDKWMRWGVHLLNAGLVLTVGMMAFKGSVQILDKPWADSPALAGVSGLGHMTLTAALILLLLAIGRQTKTVQARLDSASDQELVETR